MAGMPANGYQIVREAIDKFDIVLYFNNNTLHEHKYGNIFETNELCKHSICYLHI